MNEVNLHLKQSLRFTSTPFNYRKSTNYLSMLCKTVQRVKSENSGSTVATVRITKGVILSTQLLN
jgi:hypothetical protein